MENNNNIENNNNNNNIENNNNNNNIENIKNNSKNSNKNEKLEKNSNSENSNSENNIENIENNSENSNKNNNNNKIIPIDEEITKLKEKELFLIKKRVEILEGHLKGQSTIELEETKEEKLTKNCNNLLKGTGFQI